MNDLTAAPDAIRQYGDATAAMAAETLAAGTVDQALTVAAAIPVFGLIGQDFLATFAVAQANHLASVGELAAVHAATAVAAHQGADAYDDHEQRTAGAFDSIR